MLGINFRKRQFSGELMLMTCVMALAQKMGMSATDLVKIVVANMTGDTGTAFLQEFNNELTRQFEIQKITLEQKIKNL